MELVDVAQLHGAPATFTGSGGAVVGAYDDEAHLTDLTGAFAAVDARCLPIN